MLRTLEVVVPLHQRPAKTLARCSPSPLDHHHYAFAGNPSPFESLFSLLPVPLVYKCNGCTSRFGLLTAHFRLHALVGFGYVLRVAMYWFGPRVESLLFLFRLS